MNQNFAVVFMIVLVWALVEPMVESAIRHHTGHKSRAGKPYGDDWNLAQRRNIQWQNELTRQQMDQMTQEQVRQFQEQAMKDAQDAMNFAQQQSMNQMNNFPNTLF